MPAPQLVTLPIAVALVSTGVASFLQSPNWRSSNAKVELFSPADTNRRAYLEWVQSDGTRDPWGQITEDDMRGSYLVDATPEQVQQIVLKVGSIAWAINELLIEGSLKYASKPLMILTDNGPNGTMYTLHVHKGNQIVANKNFRFAPKDFYGIFESWRPEDKVTAT